MSELNGALVLVTGAAGGFGRHLTEQLLAAGATVIPTDRPGVPLPAIATDAGPGRLLAPIAADLSDSAGCAALHTAVEARGRPLDILINNAGVAGFGRIDEMPPARWEAILAVNLHAPIRLTALFLPRMIERGRGHICNIASLAGWSGTAGLAAYSASKFGLRGFGESLYEEVAPHGLQVTTVYPFFSRTPIIDAPRYGELARALGRMRDDALTEPADIARATLAGIRHDRLHVFPDRTARMVHWMKRLSPALLRRLSARLQRRMVAPL